MEIVRRLRSSISSNAQVDGLMVLAAPSATLTERSNQRPIHLTQPPQNNNHNAALSTSTSSWFFDDDDDVAARVATACCSFRLPKNTALHGKIEKKAESARSVRQAAPALAAIVDPCSRREAVSTGSAACYATQVHGASLQGVAYLSAPQRLESLVALPDGDREAVDWRWMLSVASRNGVLVSRMETDSRRPRRLRQQPHA